MFLYSTVSTLKPNSRQSRALRDPASKLWNGGRERHTDGGDGSDDFTELKLVENGGFTGGIESDHENTCG